MKRRTLLSAAAAASLPLAGLPVRADSYPSRPIRWINPYPPGSPLDTVARRLSELASPKVGQTIIVENKPGANGSIGTAEVARSAPDGYTFAVATADSLISVASLIKNPGYDVRKNLTPVTSIMASQTVLFASSASGWKSFQDLIAAAKASPGTIAYGSWGEGTLPHLVMTVVERQTGTNFLHVPYKGLMPIVQDLLGGNVKLAVGPAGLVKQYMQQGTVVPLMMMGPARSAVIPQVPTAKELGIDSEFLRGMFWMGLVGPKGLTDSMTQYWYKTLSDLIGTPSFAEFLMTNGGQIPRIKAPDVFARDIAAEYTTTNDLIHSLGIKPQ